jgi:heat shock protein HtpX
VNHSVGGQLADHEYRVFQQGPTMAPSRHSIGHEATRSPRRVAFSGESAGDLKGALSRTSGERRDRGTTPCDDPSAWLKLLGVGPGGPIVRSRKLEARMVLVSVLTPVTALALLAALIIVFSGWQRFLLVVGLCVGLVVTVSRMLRNPPDGRLLAESDDPELFAVMDRLCAMSDMPRPELMLSDQAQPNSWVVHLPRRKPRLYLTKGLRELLTLEELQAVLAHEQTHIANRDALVMSVIALPGSTMMNARGGPGALASVAGALSHTGTLALSRYRELAADAGAATITGRPSALASALLKVSDSLKRIPSEDLRSAAALNAFNLVAVDQRRRWWHRSRLLARVTASHPPLDERLAALHSLECIQHRSGI